MNEREEDAYVLGSKAAWRSILGEALRQLGIDDPEAGKARWATERLDAIAALRGLCDEFGDNDWPDDLHLADVINGHLGDYLLRRRDTAHP